MNKRTYGELQLDWSISKVQMLIRLGYITLNLGPIWVFIIATSKPTFWYAEPIKSYPNYKRIYVSAYPLKNTVMNKRTYYVYSIAMLHRVSKGI